MKKEAVLSSLLLVLVFCSSFPVSVIGLAQGSVTTVDISTAGTITNTTKVYPRVQVYDGEMRVMGKPAFINYSVHVKYVSGDQDVTVLIALMRTGLDDTYSFPVVKTVTLGPTDREWTDEMVWYEASEMTEDNWRIGLYASPMAAGANEVEDTNPANNYIESPFMVPTRKWPVDIDGNGRDDIMDLSRAARAFNSRPGDEMWNSMVDLDGDGYVGILDLTKIAKDFARTFDQIALPPIPIKDSPYEQLREQARKKAMEDMLIDPELSEAARIELKGLLDELEQHVKNKALEKAQDVAKKIAEKILDIFGAGKYTNVVWWVWMQAAKLGNALGCWIVNILKDAWQKAAVTFLSPKVRDGVKYFGMTLEGQAPTMPFDYVVDWEVIIEDEKGNPLSANYEITVKYNPDGTILIPCSSEKRSTSKNGYDHGYYAKNDRKWPSRVQAAKVEGWKVKSIQTQEVGCKFEGIINDKNLIIFRVIVKIVVIKPE